MEDVFNVQHICIFKTELGTTKLGEIQNLKGLSSKEFK